jgi:amino acid adenylation domain-containing protein
VNPQNSQAIAIIGMACRFPQAGNPAEFWANLKAGRESITPVPPDRWPVEQYYDPRPGTPGKSISQWGGFVADVRGFDAAFFNISPEEAAVMDPQHRLLLEMAYEALENGGYGDEQRRQGRRVGVFIGISQSSYEEFTRPLLFSGRPVLPAMLADNLRNLAAGRIANSLNLNGPCLALDTACSSSLVALHYARLSLAAGECDLALVGGINLNLTATAFIAFSSAGALSSTPHLYLFDERANGFVLGEGGGVVLLAPLAQAVEQGDPILAVVRGSAVNNDGRSLGPMAPNPAGQQAVMAAAYRAAGLEPAAISYIEAHGTGTRIGDAVEARSLSRIFPAGEGPRFVGSVKTNVGHLLSSAGMASLLKVVLALQARQIPPSLNCDQPRSNLRLERTGLTVNRQLQEWAGPGPRRAGINAFGFGGTNAHVIVEEAPERPAAATTARPSALWFISAPTESGLRRSAAALAHQLKATPWSVWPDLGYSANTARPAFPWRAALTGYGDLPARLAGIERGDRVIDGWQGRVGAGQPARIAFLLSDEGDHGQQLYHESPAFRRLYDAISHDLAQSNRPAVTEAAITQLALACLLTEWGIKPHTVIHTSQAADWLNQAVVAWIQPAQPPLVLDMSGVDSGRLAADLAAAGIELVIGIGRAGEMGQAWDTPRFESLFGEGSATLHSLYGTVARWWVAGLPLNRQAIEAGWPVRRVPVTPYPFEHTPYWVDSEPEYSPAVPVTPSKQPSVQRWLHGVTWPAQPQTESTPKLTAGRLLIVAAGPEAELVSRLRPAGTAVELVAPSQMETALQAGGASWLLYVDSLGQGDEGRLDETEHVVGLLAVAQAIGRVAPTQRPQAIVVFTAGAQRVAGEVPIPRRAMVAGLAAALNEELGITTLAVDLDPAGDGDDYLAAMQVELGQQPAAAVVAWRQGARYRRSLAPLPEPVMEMGPALHQDGVYLIVGGAGGVGAAIARSLTLEVAPTLLLTGRIPLEQAPERAALLEKLRWAGAQADYLACDVSDPVQVETLVAHIGREYGRLTGVIFAAGVIRPGRLASKTAGQFQAVLAAKVQGVPLLWQALGRQGLTPQFFTVFSSVTSVLPGLAGGLGDYAAANAYLDAFAQATPGVTAINWTIWSEAGQGANGAILDHLARSGLVGIGSAAGYQALKQVLRQPQPQVVVINPEALALSSAPVAERPAAPPVQKLAAVTAAPLPARQDDEPIRRLLREMLARELDIEAADVPLTESFAALKLDSMAALDLVLALEQKGFGRLPATLFFEYNTIEKLAAYLAETAGAAIEPAEAAPAPPVEMERPFGLSPVQLAFYTTHHIRPDEVVYAFVRQRVQGALDRERLQQAVNLLVGRQPMLRATFGNQPGGRGPQQVIRPASQPGVAPTIEWRPPASDVQVVEDELVNQRLEITAGELMRVVVIPSPDGDEWHLLLLLHHIAADGWSISLLAQELWQLYSALLAGREPVLPALPSHFRQYVELVGAETAEPARAFWQKRLAEQGQTTLVLPYDGPGRTGAGPGQRVFRFAADAALSERLKAQAAGHDLSLFHLLLAVYYQCLGRWTGQNQLVIGVAEAGRDYPLADIQRLVGCMADVFPLHLSVTADEPILALAARVRDEWLTVRHHTQLSSVELVRLLPPAAADGEIRLLNPATFSFARFPAALPADASLVIRDVVGRTATAATRLSLVCWEFEGQLHFTWNYPGYLFREESVAAFAEDFQAALAVAAGIGESDERGAAEVDNPSFIEQIDKQWQQNPERIALLAGEDRWTYGELATLASQWSTRLAAAGVTAGDVVGFLGEPSAEAIMALLAVMRLGCIWLPLEPEYPAQRLRLMVDQAGAKVLLYTAGTAAKAEALRDRVATTMVVTMRAGDEPVRPAVPFARDQSAYIIFTSGSTGQPKGVPISYRALDHYLQWASVTFAYNPADVVMEATALGFDASLRQCLVPLMNGATVVPIGRSIARDPRQLLDRLVTAGITVWSSVPSLWLSLLAYLERLDRLPKLGRLRLVQLGGEALTAGAVRRWYGLFGNQAQLANLYGPTETTINATYYLLPAELEAAAEAVPIGRGLPGRILHVIDEQGQPCSPGTTGELLVGGVGLTNGYLYDDELSGRKFITLPAWPGQRFFRTGDLVVERPDGCLLFVGRNDNQVKVRGHRIELGEIEAVLASHPAVAQAAVVAVNGDGDTTLTAFLETADPLPTAEALRAFLGQSLPVAMIPHHWQPVERLPLLANGKVDRARLVEWGRERPVELANGHPPFAGEIEPIVADVWVEVLGVRPQRGEDDFFALGGDSLNILAVLVALEERGLSVPSAAELYRHHTLAAQAEVLGRQTPRPATAMRLTVAPDEPFPLSPAQTGFLMTRSFNPPLSTTWSARFCLEGRLDLGLFEQALQALLARHPMLRTVCLPEQRPPQQREIQPDRPLPLYYEDIRAEGEAGTAALEMAIGRRQQEEHKRIFDLAHWPLIQMRLCRVADERHFWFIAADHFMGDGLSGWLFGCELIQLYDRLAAGEAAELPPLRATFRDYVALALQKEQAISEESAHYWRGVFARPYQPPQQWYRPMPAADGEWLHQTLELEPARLNALKERAAAKGQTAHDLLLALFGRQLAGLTGCDDLVVGTANAGRDYALPDLMGIFGSFATILPVRFAFDPADSLPRQVEAAVAAFRRAREHKFAPGQIARLAGGSVSLAAVSGLQFFFSFMDFESLGQPQGRHLTINWEQSQTELQPPRLGTDLVLSARALNGRLRLTFTAGTHALDQATLVAFVAGFDEALSTLLPRPPATKPLHRPAITPLDAALVAYLPTTAEVAQVISELGLRASTEQVRSLLFADGRSPRLLATMDTTIGRTGTICIPRFADELDRVEPAVLAGEVAAAVSRAADYGARCVSLAGMLPARTGYGYRVLEAMAAPNGVALTTGHSLTVVAVVKTMQQAVAAVGRQPAELSLAIVGVGSIGGATLALYLAVAEHPRQIILCDVQASRQRLQQVAAMVRAELGYAREIEIVESGSTLPAEVYTADLIVGAASQANILEVGYLRPGTVVVDDSFPNCFDRTAAVARMTGQRDVLLVGGGLLDCGPVERQLQLPGAAPAGAEQVIGYWPAAGNPGCQLESLLRAGQPGLPLTQGLVTVESARAYWLAAEDVGWRPARLHLGNFMVADSLLPGIRR